MKKIVFTLLLTLTYMSIYSQVNDTLKAPSGTQEAVLKTFDKRIKDNETAIDKLNKLKITGFIQTQWEYIDKDLVKGNEADNSFSIRRARIKFTYKATDDLRFVLQPDFSTGNLVLKDAYAVVGLPKLKNISIWAGQFNRPDYEVEYSSSQREVPERSKIIRALYPGEREIGVKIEYTGTDIPIKLQLMAMNGNFTGTQAKDSDSKKDLMGRFVYSVKTPSSDIKMDIGVSGYFGGVKAKTNKYLSKSNGAFDSISVGDYLKKQWVGTEIQLYSDFLGGVALKGEYLRGINSTSSTISDSSDRTQKIADPNKTRNFSGYYIYLIKNISNKNQAAIRYDCYDPNTRLSGEKAGYDIYFKTVTLAWQYYMNDNTRLSLSYEMPKNEISNIYPGQLRDNIFIIRVQVKF